LIDKSAKFLEKVFYPASRVVNFVGGILIIVLMLFTFSTVILRYLFNSPVPGDFELIVFSLVVLVAFAMAYTMVQGRHVTVTFFSLPKRAQAICDVITHLFSLIIFSVAAWQTVVYGNKLLRYGQHSAILDMPVSAFIYIFAFGVVLLCLVLLVKILYFITEAQER